jgi:nucleotide-binding universal stress UspA family protein
MPIEERQMSYKTILVHVDETKRARERIKIAARLAVREEAHLIGAALTGISRFLFQNAMIEQNDPNLSLHLDMLRSRAIGALEQFDPIVKQIGVTSFERRAVDDEAAGGISLQARYADVAIIGQNDPDESIPSVSSDFPEYVVLNSGRPVLIIPYTGEFDTLGERVLVAWDASMEATRAVTSAIPLLRRAKHVDLAVFNPNSMFDAHGDQPGADIALYLARHGVKIEVRQPRTETDIGNALLSMAADLSSDMIVMGGYGHSRFREVLLGGATRTVLESMTVPVWMAH